MSAISRSITSLLLLLVTLFATVHARCSSTFQATISPGVPENATLLIRSGSYLWTAPPSIVHSQDPITRSELLLLSYPGYSVGAIGSVGIDTSSRYAGPSEMLSILPNRPVSIVPKNGNPDGWFSRDFKATREVKPLLQWKDSAQWYACVHDGHAERTAQLFWLDETDQFLKGDDHRGMKYCRKVDIRAEPYGAVPPCITGYRDQNTPY